jgi:shikimate kinase
MIIHISGSSGSGKTTLGKKLIKLFPKYKIIETDKFITNKDRTKRDKIKTNKERIKFIFDIYDRKFKYYNKKYKNIIFIGLLDSSVPNGKIFNKVKFNHRLYLKISLNEFIKRYYTREVKNGILTQKKHINMVINKKWYIPSSDEVIKSYNSDIKTYKKLKYNFMTDKEIIKFINGFK